MFSIFCFIINRKDPIFIIVTSIKAPFEFDFSRLFFDRVYRTANGTVRGAAVRLGRVKIGPIKLKDVRASVNGAPMTTSLLGMKFLGWFGSYKVTADNLTLRR